LGAAKCGFVDYGYGRQNAYFSPEKGRHANDKGFVNFYFYFCGDRFLDSQ
jgi:hypothetical protein